MVYALSQSDAFYISGYKARKLVLKTNCEECRTLLFTRKSKKSVELCVELLDAAYYTKLKDYR